MRIASDCLQVDGLLVRETSSGVYESINKSPIGSSRLHAIFDFVGEEQKNFRILASRAVRNLLNQLGIITEEDVNY